MELTLSTGNINMDVEQLTRHILNRVLIGNDIDLQVKTYKYNRSGEDVWVLAVSKRDPLSLYEKAFMDMNA